MTRSRSTVPPEPLLVPDGRQPGADILTELRRLAADGWGVTPAVSSGAPTRFAGLLGSPLLQALLRDVRVPVGMYQVLLDGQPQPHTLTSVPMRVEGNDVVDALDPVRLRTEMRKGASLLLAGLDEYWPPVRRLCLELSRRSGLDVSAFAVITPPGDRGGVHPRADKTDQLVLQCEGARQWSVWPPGPQGVETQGDASLLSAPVYTGELTPGAVLYLPGGAPHGADPGTSLSIHVTVVLASPTPAEIALDAARAAAGRLRTAGAALPPFWFEDPGPHAARVQRVTEEVLIGAAATVAGDVVARAQRLSRRAG